MFNRQLKNTWNFKYLLENSVKFNVSNPSKNVQINRMPFQIDLNRLQLNTHYIGKAVARI